MLLAGALLAPAHAAPKAVYVKLTSGTDGGPVAYAELRGNEIRVAPTVERLVDAEAIKASDAGLERHGNMAYQHGTFPSVDLPAQDPEVAKVSATFSVWRAVSRSRSRRWETENFRVSAEISFAKRGPGGAVWTYVFSSHAEASAATQPSKAASLAIPPLEKLQLSMETQVKGREAGIGLRLKSGEVVLTHVRRNGDAAVCTLEIYDRQGQKVSTHKGDLQKFGFT
jgi:hypothetical protein